MTPYKEDIAFQEDAPNSLRFWNPRGGGGYFRNLWVGMCRWGPGILTRDSSAEFCYPTLEVNSPNPRYPKGGSQWGGGIYGYRLKSWLFYGYRLIFFQLRLTKELKINCFSFKKLNIN